MVGSKAAVRLAGAIFLTAVLTACGNGGGLFGNKGADRSQNLEGFTPEQIYTRGEYELSQNRSDDGLVFLGS